MPRKPKPAKLEKRVVNLFVEGVSYAVALHPPSGKRKSWYAYWRGMDTTSKATGHRDPDRAAETAHEMLKSWLARGDASRPTPADRVMTDGEFESIQKAHFGKKKDPAAQKRAAKTLKDCLDSVAAFKRVTGLERVAAATRDDCSRFQQQALLLKKTWRREYEGDGLVSSNTVLKWSRQLAAAFERANLSAGRKKCVRGVVPEAKLLTSNPWAGFSWMVEGVGKPVRHFDAGELLSLLDHVEARWPSVTAGAAAYKTLLWSGVRREELSTLAWAAERRVGEERHFEVVGKRNVRRWFRVPAGLHRELEALRGGGPFVFGAFTAQLVAAHAGRPNFLGNVRRDYLPGNFEQWLHRRVKDWARAAGKDNAYLHVFRKTGLQHSRDGEDINREVAEDARVSESVLTSHYVTQSDAQLRAGSNRTYQRVLASLPEEVARRYGHEEPACPAMERRLRAAVESRDWALAAELSARLAGGRPPGGGPCEIL